MTLSRLYRIVEARDRMVSPAEAEKHWPESTLYFDRDVGQDHSRATFFLSGDEYKNLLANTKGGGWWHYTPQLGQQQARWEKIDKPSQQRAAGHKFSRIPDGEEENIGYNEALKFYGNKAMSALKAMGIEPKSCSFDILNGQLIARVWYEGAGNLEGSYQWNEKHKTWDDQDMQAFAQEGDPPEQDAFCPVCHYIGYPNLVGQECPACAEDGAVTPGTMVSH